MTTMKSKWTLHGYALGYTLTGGAVCLSVRWAWGSWIYLKRQTQSRFNNSYNIHWKMCETRGSIWNNKHSHVLTSYSSHWKMCEARGSIWNNKHSHVLTTVTAATKRWKVLKSSNDQNQFFCCQTKRLHHSFWELVTCNGKTLLMASFKNIFNHRIHYRFHNTS